MKDFVEEIIKTAKKRFTEYLGWDEGQKHDETKPTVASERRKQIEKNRKGGAPKEVVYPWTQNIED